MELNKIICYWFSECMVYLLTPCWAAPSVLGFVPREFESHWPAGLAPRREWWCLWLLNIHTKKSSQSTNNTATACSSNQGQKPNSRLPESLSTSASFFSSCSLRRSFVRMLSSKRRRRARISCRCSPSMSDGQAYTKYWIKKTPVSIQVMCILTTVVSQIQYRNANISKSFGIYLSSSDGLQDDPVGWLLFLVFVCMSENPTPPFHRLLVGGRRSGP